MFVPGSTGWFTVRRLISGFTTAKKEEVANANENRNTLKEKTFKRDYR